MRYAAFLRAINIGKNNRIRMEDLRSMCAGLGFGEVATYLQTGNIRFEWEGTLEAARDLLEGALIERGLKNCSAMVWPVAELEAFVATEPFVGYPADGNRQYVTLYRGSLPAEHLTLLRELPATVALTDRIHCSAYPAGTSTVDVMNSPVARAIKVPGTVRYWHVFEAFLANA
ncbi:MAG TPA: DUF1697 domain-containing protein [Tepidiformaceae bacterium]|nr:DUF1697 domain-containing protein [Tepidiformaceae bacterium]